MANEKSEFNQIIWLEGNSEDAHNPALIQADPNKASDPGALEELKSFL